MSQLCEADDFKMIFRYTYDYSVQIKLGCKSIKLKQMGRHFKGSRLRFTMTIIFLTFKAI
jgi:hypothetical protein